MTLVENPSCKKQVDRILKKDKALLPPALIEAITSRRPAITKMLLEQGASADDELVRDALLAHDAALWRAFVLDEARDGSEMALRCRVRSGARQSERHHHVCMCAARRVVVTCLSRKEWLPSQRASPPYVCAARRVVRRGRRPAARVLAVPAA